MRRSISALTSAGLAGGYLVNPRLAHVHWQPGDRQVPEAVPAIAGETPLFVEPYPGPAYRAVGWRDAYGKGPWTWHSLRHVFCTTALLTWKIDAADVSRPAGHASIRITLGMYIGTTAGTAQVS